MTGGVKASKSRRSIIVDDVKAGAQPVFEQVDREPLLSAGGPPAPPNHRPRNVVETASGYYLMRADSLDWLKALPTTARCLFCPDFVFEGTAEEAADANKRHRHEAHPTLVGMTAFQRKKLAIKNGAAIGKGEHL